MPIRLIDPKKEKCINIDGTEIYYRQLSGREQALLGLELSDLNIDADTSDNAAGMEIAKRIEKIEPILTRAITKVKNPDIEPVELMATIADSADYMRIAFEIFTSSSVSEAESKNSECSSSSKGQKTEETARAVKPEKPEVKIEAEEKRPA